MRGTTTDIREAIRCRTSIKVNNRPVYACGLVMPRQNVLFGSWLRERDKQAVIEVINDYLHSQPSS